ncbi:MAG: hypothetical protein ACRCXB_26285, partial [Aeromonadaceae bacterium]
GTKQVEQIDKLINQRAIHHSQTFNRPDVAAIVRTRPGQGQRKVPSSALRSSLRLALWSDDA